MAFVYIFNLFQVPNVAWQSYLQLTLHFEPWILGLTVTLGSFMTFAGILAYKYVFFKASWRSIYIWSVGLTTFFSFLQLLLIFQVNNSVLHLNNYLFSLGDDVIQSYISGIQFLPLCIMYMRLCPDGAEGSSYSMLTTFGNIALVCASNLGNLVANIWDVSNEGACEMSFIGGERSGRMREFVCDPYLLTCESTHSYTYLHTLIHTLTHTHTHSHTTQR